MQSLANYRQMHMRMQQLAAEGVLDGIATEVREGSQPREGSAAKACDGWLVGVLWAWHLVEYWSTACEPLVSWGVHCNARAGKGKRRDISATLF